MNIKPEETIVIGDQMLTDVFGGNRNGFIQLWWFLLNVQMVLLQSSTVLLNVAY